MRFVPLVICLCLFSSRALADDKRTCADAYEGAQRHRSERKFLVARAELEICTRTCPTELATDCQRWSEEVQALVSRVKVVSKHSDVSVSIAGRVVRPELDGTPIELDPGDHELLFRRGSESVKERVSLKPGQEKEVVVELGEAPAPPPASPPVTRDAPRVETRPGPPFAAYLFGAIGVAGLATGATFATLGHLKASELRDTCKPNCTESEVDGVRTQWLIGGIAAGVGAVSLGIGGYLWLSSSPTKDGAVLRARVTF